MGAFRPSRIYCVFVATQALQVALLALIGDSTITLRGLVPGLLLVIWLGYGSRIAWGLFLAINALELIAVLALVLALPAGGTLWGDVAVMLLGSTALIGVLVSPAMRTHLSSHRSLPASPHHL